MIKLLFTGDIMLSRDVGDKLDKNIFNNILSKDIMIQLQNSDFIVGNLENPVSDNAKKINNKSFRAKPKHLNQIINFNLVSIANNHILDCGEDGLSDTLENLDKKNILYNGVSLNNKIEPTVININNKSVAFLSLLDFEPFNNYGSGSEVKPFSANDVKTLNIIEEVSLKNDIVIILLHGDNEMIPYPSPRFRSMCKEFISSGANLVITHHPHVLGGFEKYKNGKIFYSLGDFIFDGQSHSRRKSCMLQITLIDNEITHKIIPTIISNDLKVKIADKKNEGLIKSKYSKISSDLIDKNYNSKYKNRYIIALIRFQLDRIKFLLFNEGLFFTIKFILTKLLLLRYYFKLIKKQ